MTGFPDPAARSPAEAAFLTAVLADLSNDLPKLLYADWLDDHADARGDFLRRFTHAARAGTDLPAPPPGTPVGWLALTGCDLLAGLRRHDLTHLTEPLLRLARPVVFVTAKAASDGGLPAGASKFGGDPDLPADADWPADAAGPLPFLAQFNFAELAGSPAAGELPRAGLLSVFYDGQEWGEGDGWRLVHTPAGVPLARRPTPAGAARDYLAVTPQCRLTFTEGLDVPDTDSPWSGDLDFREDGYGPRQEAYRDLRTRGPAHHLLGYPRLIQSNMLHTADRRLLLSLDSDDEPDWCWGDVGTLYFTLPAGSLAAGRLADGAGFEMQCS